jgi:hypothetical protein
MAGIPVRVIPFLPVVSLAGRYLWSMLQSLQAIGAGAIVNE